jgi:hypothetical protein
MTFVERLAAILRQGTWVALVSGLLTMVGLVAAVFSSRNERYRAAEQDYQTIQGQRLALQQSEQFERTNKELADLRMTNAAIMKSLEQVRKSGKAISFSNLDPTDRQSIEEIRTAETKLDARLGGLETSIMASPEKAVALPMLKQQLDSLQDRTHSDLDGIRGEIGRLFTLTQWFIGLMFTIALGMFGLSFNLRKAAATADGEKASPGKPA